MHRRDARVQAKRTLSVRSNELSFSSRKTHESHLSLSLEKALYPETVVRGHTWPSLRRRPALWPSAVTSQGTFGRGLLGVPRRPVWPAPGHGRPPAWTPPPQRGSVPRFPLAGLVAPGVRCLDPRKRFPRRRSRAPPPSGMSSGRPLAAAAGRAPVSEGEPGGGGPDQVLGSSGARLRTERDPPA